MKNLNNKKILFIICGGISAYKSLETIRLLKKNGAEIKTILTSSAKEFVTPLSVASLSQGKVYSDLFSLENETEMDHISLSRWADIVIVAPTTANTISKLAQGTTDDLASTVILASNKQIYLAPAMNVRMWEHKSTKTNLKKLKDFGYKFIGPEIGDMACGEYGEGKMSEPLKIADELNQFFLNQSQNKKFKALVTAGPTNEYIDPVRFITNKSSGKQGGGPLHDPCTIAWMLQPEMFSGRHCNVEIETESDLTMGMTVIDWWQVTDRPHNAFVVGDLDADAFFRLITDRLAKLP